VLGRLLALVVLAAALLLALRTARVPARLQRRAAVLVGLALVSALAALLSNRDTAGFEDALTLVLVGVTPVVLAARLVRNPDVTAESLLGALCVYLLSGLFFALVFSLTADLTATPFFASLSAASPADYLYFSYVTLTTVGYGDLVARTTLGRMLAVTEALTGQAYLVTVVALLVSNFRPRPRDRDESTIQNERERET
jgi:voltage-gated potassium channel Kch